MRKKNTKKQKHQLICIILFISALSFSCTKKKDEKVNIKLQKDSYPHLFNSYILRNKKIVTFQNVSPDLSNYEAARSIVETMDDKEIVGQLFMLGYSGREANKTILDWISNRKIGSVKIFGNNGKEINEICKSVTKMQKAALNTRKGIPLFIATDQEGGWVRHIKAGTSKTAGNMSIGATGFLKDAYDASYYMAEEIKYLGINMNFAPTVDLYLDKRSVIIGSRAFSDDPILTANMAVGFLKGHESHHIIATAKHFPGHGNSKEDSHGKLPIIDSDLEFITQHDLVPYLFLIKEKVPAIMIGHISFPNITKKNEPATLSPILVKDLLRKKLKYDGIIITDDLNMHGMKKKGVETGDKSLAALMAGNDIILISYNKSKPYQHQHQWESVLKEFKTNKKFHQQIVESATRIIRTKLKYLKCENHVPFFPDERIAQKNIPSKEGARFFFNQACRSITQVSISNEKLIDKSKILLVGADWNFFVEGKKRCKYPASFSLSSLETIGILKTANQIKNIMQGKDAVIIEVFTNKTLQLAKKLKQLGLKVFVINSYNPGYAVQLTEMNHAVAIYGNHQESFQAAFGVLYGDIEAIGKLPLKSNHY